MKIRSFVHIVILCSLTSEYVVAQSVTDTLQTGIVYERINSLSDPDKSYALFLPEDYDREQLFPVVFLMDPRGAAMRPMGLFKDIADSLGYVLVSSWDTRSDTDPQLTINALNAMLQDVLNNLYVALDRVYLAGFSGTARMSWDFALELPDNVAGVISFGAGTGQGFEFESLSRGEDRSFAYFGSSGFYDFNYFEMLQLDRLMEEYDFNYKLRFFEGGHQWPPKEIAEEALSFMHLMAMNEGGIEQDSRFLKRAWELEGEVSKEILNSEDLYRLWRHQASLLRNYPAEMITGSLKEEQVRLEERLRASGETALIEKLMDDYFSFLKFMFQQFNDLSTIEDPPPAVVFAELLRVNDLKERLDREEHLYKKRQAAIFLELIRVHTLFYQTNAYLESGRYQHARTMVETAALIRKDALLCRQQVRIYTALGDDKMLEQSRKCED
ncbi:hypothetical protein AB2B38_009010 [Balneola sp. MJW-20]|uniref:hypothetical protein n=1 Tax=Gracilimonas aurantiaca TaxID=3234185 RepID=UPI0034661935